MKPLLAILVLAALSGCPTREAPTTGPSPDTFTQQKQLCEKRGGRWGQGGGKGFFVCYNNTRDGGQECSKASDCEGLCLARSRTCAPVKPLYGCQEVLDVLGVRRSSALTRTFATIALVVTLAGCQPAPPVQGFRDTAVPITSMALFAQSSLAGQWDEVAGYPLRPGCAPGALTVAAGGGTAGYDGCYLPLGATAALTPSGPGRFTSGGQEYWLLWLDVDNRTAVIGTPSGGFGAVLNRSAGIPPDRLAAAKKVLGFNGYDLGRLVVR